MAIDIDQDRYNKLADWAESADRDIHPERGETSTAATRSSRELIPPGPHTHDEQRAR
ncbi:MAG: hypothetical protein WBB07_18275 [Mycobacterium sp.]|jgi:hypothetical protein